MGGRGRRAVSEWYGLKYINFVGRGKDLDILYQGDLIMTRYADGSVYVTDAARTGEIIARRLNQIAEKQALPIKFQRDKEVDGIWARIKKRSHLLPAFIEKDELETA